MQLINDFVKKEEKKDFSQMTEKELMREVLALMSVLNNLVALLPMKDFSLMTVIQGAKTIYNKVHGDPVFYKKFGIDAANLYAEIEKRYGDNNK